MNRTVRQIAAHLSTGRKEKLQRVFWIVSKPASVVWSMPFLLNSCAWQLPLACRIGETQAVVVDEVRRMSKGARHRVRQHASRRTDAGRSESRRVNFKASSWKLSVSSCTSLFQNYRNRLQKWHRFFIDAQQGITEPNVRWSSPAWKFDQPHTHFISPESLLRSVSNCISGHHRKRTSPVFRRLEFEIQRRNCLHKQIKQCANVFALVEKYLNTNKEVISFLRQPFFYSRALCCFVTTIYFGINCSTFTPSLFCFSIPRFASAMEEVLTLFMHQWKPNNWFNCLLFGYA